MASTARQAVRDVPAKTDPAVPGPPRGRVRIDVRSLERALRAEVEGEVRFDRGSLAMYANDASNYRQVPIGVVVPKTLDDVVAAHRVASRFGAPVLNRGGGTSLSGETVNYALVLDHTKYLTGIGECDPERRQVTCEPGVINEQLNIATGTYGLVFGPDPSSHSRCAIGGNIGNNSCGIHSVQSQLYGPGPRTSDNVEALEIVTYDGERFWVGVDEEDRLDAIIAEGGRKGEIYAKLRDLRDRYADAIRGGFAPVTEVPRRVSGYNLDELLPERGFNVARALVGTESTCVTVLRSTLLLTPALRQRTLVVVRYDDIVQAAEHVTEIVEKWRPIGLEALDHDLIESQLEQHMHAEDIKELPGAPEGAWLLVQFGADTADESLTQAERFTEWLRRKKKYSDDRMLIAKSVQEGGNSEDIWEIREGGLGGTAFAHGRDNWPGWEDSAVPPERIGEYLAALQEKMAEYGLSGAMYGHLAQGCVHSRINFDLRSRSGIRTYRAFLEDAADLVVSFGGSLSGEHGDGQQRGELLEKQYGPRLLQAMREFKAIWDPEYKMNPGKVVDAYPLDEDLRLGTDYNPWRPDTTMFYGEERGDFAHAGLRCVGIGKCRNPTATQTMCPSYQVTREEKHSTRGRARLLFEMLQGDVITDGWQSKDVAESLDLCLACKGCTSDCPVKVDVPTYKAEFRHHHYRSWRRWRPRHAYALGLIDQASRVAARVPALANLATQTPVLSRLTKLVAGLDQKRPLPAFAPMTLQEWFRRRGGTANPHGRPVVLFPDTFNNHLHTDVGVACVEEIEAAGWRVIMPQAHVCCGRPLYDYGFLDLAQRYLARVLDQLRPYLREDVPIVGMEPSCLAVFKDELFRMMPHDDDARRLAANAYHFPEFFRTFGIEPPEASGDALLWGHCHQRATGGMDPERELLEDMGLSVQNLKGGCCGLAGSWGFEDGKYDISMDCGEQALLPAVREADPSTLVVADGFSCSSQIADAGTGRTALHTAQVMRMARSGEHGLPGKPEPSPARRAARAGTVGAVAAAVTAATVTGARAWRGKRR
ncbi:FAD-binding and (Fe-S)-binding domain-containing protein [Prauserella muralis]|uniref:Dimethylmenaquinone methyltransferase n=1 Tax=Prauserella muralis TaxID=588067 RepID=A0A2V4AQ87_9PSEU|nr:FAD-binding and (Fe-S)-binding domain-containing protein [Prauserella muralis]PXY22184.1 dimethylmenaquinone methyltransferase [Prauserella muralis]TWE27793.1 FAD/FMN-containing dehydrogenase [Prauserella muralis]